MAKRRELARAANDKLETLAFHWQSQRWTGKGDKIRPLVEQRTPAQLDREQRLREAFRREELDYRDPDYEVLLGARMVKPSEPSSHL